MTLSAPQDLAAASSPSFTGLTVSGLTATRLVASNGASAVASSALSDWVTGTSDRVTVADDGDGTITLSGPQDLASTSSPSFTGLTVSGLTATRLVASNGASAVASSALSDWVTGTSDQVTVTDDADGTITLSGPQDLATTSSPSFAGQTIRLNGTPMLSLEATQTAHTNGGQASFISAENSEGIIAQIRFAHSGTADDHCGSTYFYVNNGAEQLGQILALQTGVIQVGSSVDYADLYPYSSNSTLGLAGNPWGTVYYTSLSEVSDENLKKDIIDLPAAYGLPLMRLMKPRRFKWKETSKDQRPRAGLVAQEVKQALLDHGIKEDESSFFNEEGGNYSLQSHQFIACLIKAIQELDARVTSLET
jgi:hypothetical protein